MLTRGLYIRFFSTIKEKAKLNKTKKILVAVFVTNLLCSFVAGHGGIPLGLLELLTLYSALTLTFDEFPLFSYWTLATALMIVGQILTIMATRKKNLSDTTLYGRFGTIFLLLPVVIIILMLSEQVWTVALISSMPFLILTIIFWWNTRSSKAQLLISGT
ncbi:MAG: hypothetical protein ABI315_02240 [Bacteroidia bacterium]